MTAALLLKRVSYSVPELTGSTGIQLNERVSLRRHFNRLSSLEMKRKHPISEQQRRCTTASDPIRELAKQYKELCRLREQVQIAESRHRVLSRARHAA
jgi:hypothetical protein